MMNAKKNIKKHKKKNTIRSSQKAILKLAEKDSKDGNYNTSVNLYSQLLSSENIKHNVKSKIEDNIKNIMGYMQKASEIIQDISPIVEEYEKKDSTKKTIAKKDIAEKEKTDEKPSQKENIKENNGLINRELVEIINKLSTKIEELPIKEIKENAIPDNFIESINNLTNLPLTKELHETKDIPKGEINNIIKEQNKLAFGQTEGGGQEAVESGGQGAVESGGQGAVESGGQGAVESGGQGAVESGGQEAVESGGQGAVESGGQEAVESGGQGAVESGGQEAVESGGQEAVESGGQEAVESGGQEAVESGGQEAVESGGQEAVESGGQEAVESGGQEAVESGGQEAVESGGQEAVESGGQEAVESGGQEAVESGGQGAVESGGQGAVESGGQGAVESGGQGAVESGGQGAVESGGQGAVESGGQEAVESGDNKKRQGKLKTSNQSQEQELEIFNADEEIITKKIKKTDEKKEQDNLGKKEDIYKAINAMHPIDIAQKTDTGFVEFNPYDFKEYTEQILQNAEIDYKNNPTQNFKFHREIDPYFIPIPFNIDKRYKNKDGFFKDIDENPISTNGKDKQTQSEITKKESEKEKKKKEERKERPIQEVGSIKPNIQKVKSTKKSIKLTFDFKDMFNDKYYRKYRNMLNEAAYLVAEKKLDEALEYYYVIQDQQIPKSFKMMVQENIKDIENTIIETFYYSDTIVKVKETGEISKLKIINDYHQNNESTKEKKEEDIYNIVYKEN